MVKEELVVVVAISDYSWDVLLEKKFYACPMRSRKVGKYFAFYRKGEIAYYAKVKKSEEGSKTDVGIGYWLYCMPDSEPPFQLVRFDKITKLRSPIKKDDLGRGKGMNFHIHLCGAHPHHIIVWCPFYSSD